ncbi:MAG: hypothetical protein WC938_02490 [Candidatus Paceibacterota bacterium]|jgi:hypothetical protein
MESTNQKSKTTLEKIAPYVLIVGVIILGYFGLTKINITPAATNILPINGSETIQVEVDTNFLASAAFTALKYIPDSSIFDEVNGEVPSGRDDPFAPVK